MESRNKRLIKQLLEAFEKCGTEKKIHDGRKRVTQI